MTVKQKATRRELIYFKKSHRTVVVYECNLYSIDSIQILYIYKVNRTALLVEETSCTVCPLPADLDAQAVLESSSGLGLADDKNDVVAEVGKYHITLMSEKNCNMYSQVG